MAEKAKMSARDSALIGILERMADQLQKQDTLLEDVIRRQNEFARLLESTEHSRGSMQKESDISLKKLGDLISRYRSDMLKLVNEQDRINKNLDESNKVVNKTAYAIENNNQKLDTMDERIRSQEKSVSGHYEHSVKHAEDIPRILGESTRGIMKMHVDTEKQLEKLHHETQQQLEKLRQEATRRLLALDGIETALHTLLIRTEPRARKPFFLTLVFKSIGGFFRYKLPSAFKKLKVRRK